MLDVEDLGELELNDWEGKKSRLGDFWAESPAVIVFIRHFG